MVEQSVSQSQLRPPGLIVAYEEGPHTYYLKTQTHRNGRARGGIPWCRRAAAAAAAAASMSTYMFIHMYVWWDGD